MVCERPWESGRVWLKVIEDFIFTFAGTYIVGIGSRVLVYGSDRWAISRKRVCNRFCFVFFYTSLMKKEGVTDWCMSVFETFTIFLFFFSFFSFSRSTSLFLTQLFFCTDRRGNTIVLFTINETCFPVTDDDDDDDDNHTS